MISPVELLKRYDVDPKKSLGQNFLLQDSLLEKIATIMDVSQKHVIEVGPGIGNLSAHILEHAPKSLTMIDLDPVMISILQDRLSRNELALDTGKIHIIHSDILKYTPTETSYILLGNVPYYITTAIITRFLMEVEHPASELVLLIPKDVTQKIIGIGGNSYISTLIAYLTSEQKECFDIGPANFSPPPKIISSILYLRAGENAGSNNTNTKRFVSILKCGFAHPRKKLISNLLAHPSISRDMISSLLLDNGYSENVRAEELSLDMWKQIAQI